MSLPVERLATKGGSSSTLVRAMDLAERRGNGTVKEEPDEEEEAMRREMQDMWVSRILVDQPLYASHECLFMGPMQEHLLISRGSEELYSIPYKHMAEFVHVLDRGTACNFQGVAYPRAPM